MVKSKTMWFSLLLVIFGALMDNITVLQSVIPSQYYGLVLAGIGIIVAVLRFLTTKPLDEK